MRKVSLATRAELVEAAGKRYRSADRRSKGHVLDEFVAVTGFHRKHAMRLLGTKRPAKAEGPRTERRIYNEALRTALIVLWEAADRLCGKRLRPLIPILQDTTEFVYQRASPESTGFTKHVNSGRDKEGRWRQHKLCGVLMHASLAITLEGLPLGLTAARFWTRAQFKGTLALKRHVNPTGQFVSIRESVGSLIAASRRGRRSRSASPTAACRRRCDRRGCGNARTAPPTGHQPAPPPPSPPQSSNGLHPNRRPSR
jgi:hypothetical protein